MDKSDFKGVFEKTFKGAVCSYKFYLGRDEVYIEGFYKHNLENIAPKVCFLVLPGAILKKEIKEFKRLKDNELYYLITITNKNGNDLSFVFDDYDEASEFISLLVGFFGYLTDLAKNFKII